MDTVDAEGGKSPSLSSSSADTDKTPGVSSASSMSTNSDLDFNALRRLCILLIEERDCLKTELKYANLAMDEFSSQVKTSNTLLEQANVALAAHNANSNLQRKSSWIWGSWLPSAVDSYFLNDAETAFRESHWQKAINLLSTLVLRRNITSRTRVNAKLLMATVLRLCDQPRRALVLSEEALSIAHRQHLTDLIGKAQFYRATCLFDAREFADASWCLGLAAGTPDFAEKIAEWKAKSETERQGLPEGHRGRYVRDTFLPVPLERSFGNADARIIA
ncbi:MAG: hypothetical protein M1837_001158 [Sclerophora amabilis]|nr:MAG: hypothetical protein M1837_001158 [Sclerophora amabilis]